MDFRTFERLTNVLGREPSERVVRQYDELVRLTTALDGPSRIPEYMIALLVILAQDKKRFGARDVVDLNRIDIGKRVLIKHNDQMYEGTFLGRGSFGRYSIQVDGHDGAVVLDPEAVERVIS